MSAAVASDLQKFAIKVFLRNPEGLDLEAMVPVYHRWIRDRRLPGVLIDVADYGHLPDGPGVVLIGHEADLFMDSMEGPAGLLYNRKLRQDGPLAGRVASALKAALEACRLLEAEPELAGRAAFDGGKALFIANDRLVAPNDEETFRLLRPDLEKAFGRAFGGRVELRREAGDPRRRLAVLAEASAPADLATVLGRLG